MRNDEWASMREADFDAMLKSSVSESPPEDVVSAVSPCKKALNRVLIGIVLSAITLNFWCLDYILPSVGALLSLLGFRALRRENKWFFYCFALTIVSGAYLFCELILNTTILQSAFYASSVETFLSVVGSLLLLLKFYCFWRGICIIQEKAALPAHANSVLALVVWYAVMLILAIFHCESTFVIGIVIIIFAIIVCNIAKLSKELDAVGYAIANTSHKISDRCLVCMILAALTVGCACGYLFGDSYRMDWQTVDAAEHNNVSDIKSNLLDLGFPEAVLNDLGAADIAACNGAVQVKSGVSDHFVYGCSNLPDETYNNLGSHNLQPTATRDLRITNVAVKLSGTENRWMTFQHFRWLNHPRFYGTEAFYIVSPAYRYSKDCSCAGEATGRVLYDDDGGNSYASPYHFLGEQDNAGEVPILDFSEEGGIIAGFSVPRQCQNCRGYIAYPVIAHGKEYTIGNFLKYFHQRSCLQYPAVTAMEFSKDNAWNTFAFSVSANDFLFSYESESIEGYNRHSG
ncbi:MAG: hypothetical protein KBS74_04550 [Clostridiales bacterium]|nr:hypothetical protein [Candidatus Cacconaster stercorequi]